MSSGEGWKGRVVLTTVNHLNKDLYELDIVDSDGNLEQIKVTGAHRFFSVSRGEWIAVENLRIRELLKNIDRRSEVAAIRRIPGVYRVYNLTVEEDHVYHIGTFYSLVHNNCGRLLTNIRKGSSGELRSAFAKLGKKFIGTGTATNRASRAFARKMGTLKDDAGHAIGKLLGGKGGVKSGNIFSQSSRVNRGAFAKFEKQIAGLVNEGNNVFVRVVPKYLTKGATRASGVLYQVRVNGKTMSRWFLN